MEDLKNDIDKLKERGKNLRRDVRIKTAGYLIAAFGLVAGLAWNNAVTSLIDYLFPFAANTVLAKFIYAIVITLVVVFVGTYLSHLGKEE